MKYKMGFTMGDYSQDGHNISEVKHIECNYSVEEITKAYKEASKELGFDFINEVCKEYEEHSMPISVANRLNGIHAIDIEDYEDQDGGLLYIEDANEYIDIFFGIVRTKLPNLEYSDVVILEDKLDLLQGAGYGLYHQ